MQTKTIIVGTQQRKEKLAESLELPTNKVGKIFALPSSNILIHPSFPGWITNQKKNEIETEIFETFQKVKVDIPLLDTIKQISWRENKGWRERVYSHTKEIALKV